MNMIREQFKKMESKIDERKTEYETKTNDVITKLKENMKPAQISSGFVSHSMSPIRSIETNFSNCSLGINRNVILSNSPFSRIGDKRFSSFDTIDSRMVTNCVVLHSGSMLFTDFSKNSRLILYDPNGNFLRYIKVESNPFDLAVFNESVLAVTLTNAKKVLFLDLNHDNVVTSFSTVGECYGIDLSDFSVTVIYICPCSSLVIDG
jgi:hypothetical protein